MDAQKIRDFRLAQPFHPFDLVMSDGRKLPVVKPYHLAIAPTGRFLIYSSETGFEQLSTQDVHDIVQQGSSGSNGRN